MDLTRTPPARGVARLPLLLLPAALLMLASWGAPDTARLLLGPAAFVLAVAGGLLGSRGVGASSLAAVLLYVVALAWLLLAAPGVGGAAVYAARAVLLVVAVALFARYCLRQSGALLHREARRLAGCLGRRRDLPADLATSRLLPEVQAFRAALAFDAGPALALLSDPRHEVRVAALAALEARPSWQPGEAGLVLSLAQQTPDPETRAAAVLALAGCTARAVVEPLAEFLADPAPVVRRAAAEAVLWDTDDRWEWIRHPYRLALATPEAEDDGPLLADGCLLSAEAAAELAAWTAEKGALAARSARTLGAHYGRLFARAPDAALAVELRRQAADPQTPAGLRLELAQLLHEYQELDDVVMRQLIDPAAPAPLRLVGVEALLAEGGSAEAVAALHELARLPNREIALAVAEVAQRRLGLEFGLPPGPLPPVHGRLAAAVARRVQRWATGRGTDQEEDADDAPEDAAWRSTADF
jgi:hypothetical protein